MCRKWPIYILKVLLENLYDARFSFHRQSQFLHISPYTDFVNKNCCTPSIDFKPFPMNLWRNWHLFEHQKRPNRIINIKVTLFCTNVHFREQLENIFIIFIIFLAILFYIKHDLFVDI